MLQIQDSISIDHEGVIFTFKACDIFDIIDAEELHKTDVSAYYKWFLDQLISVTGIMHGEIEITATEVKERKIKLPTSFIVAAIAKFKNKTLTGKDFVDKDEAEKND